MFNGSVRNACETLTYRQTMRHEDMAKKNFESFVGFYP